MVSVEEGLNTEKAAMEFFCFQTFLCVKICKLCNFKVSLSPLHIAVKI